jgi:hypothetical protein
MDFGEEQTVQVEVQCIEGVDEPRVSFVLCEGSKGVAKITVLTRIATVLAGNERLSGVRRTPTLLLYQPSDTSQWATVNQEKY